jgi:hypothetical protein
MTRDPWRSVAKRAAGGWRGDVSAVSTISKADATLPRQILRYAPDDDRHRKIDAFVAEAQRSPVAWDDLAPDAAALLWEDAVWLRNIFASEERDAVDLILAHLALVIRPSPGWPFAPPGK